MFELLCNVLLVVFLGYTYFTHVLEAKVPKSYLKNPNNLMPDVWPKLIIILLLVCLIANIIKIILKNKGNKEFNLKSFGKNSLNFFKSKMFLGMVLLAFAAFILEYVGFVVTAFVVLFLYGLLLGERKLVRLLIVSVVLAFLLHFLFCGLLDVNLPRGEVPFLRNMALFLESIV